MFVGVAVVVAAAEIVGVASEVNSDHRASGWVCFHFEDD